MLVDYRHGNNEENLQRIYRFTGKSLVSMDISCLWIGLIFKNYRHPPFQIQRLIQEINCKLQSECLWQFHALAYCGVGRFGEIWMHKRRIHLGQLYSRILTFYLNALNWIKPYLRLTAYMLHSKRASIKESWKRTMYLNFARPFVRL